MAVVGRVARPHGLHGQVVVNPDTDFPDQRFKPGEEIFVEQSGVPRPLVVESVRFQRGRPIVGFEGVQTVEAAETFAGAELRIPIDRLTALPDGMFYRHDLIGCQVETGSGDTIGSVAEVEGDAGGSRLVVEGKSGPVLIPLAAEICRVIDPIRKRIVIDPPDGLLELNTKL